MDWGREGLAFLADQEDEDLGWGSSAGVFRVMHHLGRVMERLTRLEGHRRFPLGLQSERAIDDIGELRPWVKVFACSGAWGQVRDVHDPFLVRHIFEIGFQQLRALDGRLLGLLLAVIAVQFILQGVEETVIRLLHQFR